MTLSICLSRNRPLNFPSNLQSTLMDWKNKIADYVLTHGPKLASAILIMAVGFLVARSLGGLVKRWLGRKELQLEPPPQVLILRSLKLLIFLFSLGLAASTPGGDVAA